MFKKKANTEWSIERYVTELDGYHIMVQLSHGCNDGNIAGGTVSKMVMYPLSISGNKDIVVYDMGWRDGVPEDIKVRHIIEKIIHHFDNTYIDWEQEQRKGKLTAMV
ncbi:DUF7678 domain-containing protein [Paenibacillus amylolyticus]|uniref:DUF7678 domain-containing protein n=1 Tax=Paenibacillus amylolyticus TaxID=1451 RepID=A0ABD8B340_PAEAM